MWDSLLAQVREFLSYDSLKPLLFTQVDFWVFLLVLSAGYLCVQRKLAVRNFYLLIFSLLFYYKSCGLFAILLVASILFNYAMALAIAAGRTRWQRKGMLSIAVAVNLFLLAYFKYSHFFVGIINSLFDTHFEATNALGVAIASLFGDGHTLVATMLPVGLSFYTFQAISYVVDVYRRQLPPLHRPEEFGFYLAFFPQLVAGPIVRASEFIPQIYQPYRVSQRELGHALFLILGGLFKKIVLSDYIGLNLVDRVFNSPTAYTGLENLIASYGYTLQIYCDFSGYTDIAIGVALLLGFRLSINFNFPYRAASLTDFWRRWHISLSTWLRDHLYIPLGGNRHGAAVMYLALMTTMLLGGLWHGASWNFVIWGGAHGVGLVASKLIARLPAAWLARPAVRALRWLLTFHFVVLCWIFFRAQGLQQALDVVAQIGREFHPEAILQALQGYRTVLLLMALGYFLHWMPGRWIERVRGGFIALPTAAKFALTLVLVLLMLKVQTADLQPFIYFDF
ncbi:MAG: MBOAT family O-acyltransferase [Bacteroides sp.]|jgi:hypothetical protein BACCOPRO_02376